VGQDARFRGERHVAFGSLICGCAVARPFACFGAFVCCLGSVVEAELAGSGVSEVALGRLGDEKRALPFTTLAFEGKQV
jgi:hypothetical protein